MRPLAIFGLTPSHGLGFWQLDQGKASSGLFLSSSSASGRNSPFASSSVIQDIMAICEAGSAIMAYFYFDFRDLDKQTCHDLLLSLVSQLSIRSSSYCDILHGVYEAHEKGTRQPSDDTLKECLKDMLRLPGQGPTFIILDALDECPDSSGFPSARDEVLQLVKELIDLRLQELHICATSRPEVDIRAVLEPLAFFFGFPTRRKRTKNRYCELCSKCRQLVLKYGNEEMERRRQNSCYRDTDRKSRWNVRESSYCMLESVFYVVVQVQMGILPIGDATTLLPTEPPQISQRIT